MKRTKAPDGRSSTSDELRPEYDLDYRNARPKYIETFLNHLANWDFAAANLLAASKG